MKNGNDINENKEEKKKDKKKKHKKHKKEKQMNDPTCNAILKEEIEQSTAQPFDDSSCNRKDDDDGNKNTQSKKKSAKEEKEQKKKLEKQLKKEAKKLEKRQNKEQTKEKTNLKKEEKKKRKERDDNMTTDDDVVDNRPKRPKNNSKKYIEETDTICATYYDLIKGKDGEMIRDLKVRSGCKIQINKNVLKGARCRVKYRGKRQTVDFAKRLISLLCSSENGKEADLPLGKATRKHLVVSADVISLIVGEGGKVIQELQRKSQAKIEVDDPEGAECANSSQRQVTITGREQNVLKAEEMINFLTSNGAMDESQALGMLIEDKWKRHIESETFPCPKMYIGRVMGKRGSRVMNLKKKSGCNIQINQDVPTGHDCQIILKGTRQRIESAKTMLREFIETWEHIESEIFPCPKMCVGNVIGKKRKRVNKLQRKSGCDIQFNQDVPTGHDCQIILKGSRQRIESAKTMLREIIETNPKQ